MVFYDPPFFLRSYLVHNYNMSSSAMVFGIKKFDGRIIFVLWKIQVNIMLIQSELHNVLANTWTLVVIDARCVVKLCRLLENFLRKPTWRWRLHYIFQHGFDMETFFLKWFGFKWSIIFMVEYGGSFELGLSV